MASFTSLIKMSEALAIGIVEALQLFRGARIADELVARKQFGLNAAREEPLRHFTAKHVENHGAGDGRDRPGAPFEARDLKQAIARRAMIVNHDIGDINQFLAGGV